MYICECVLFWEGPNMMDAVSQNNKNQNEHKIKL